jgi:hypothetical protein
MRRSPNLWWRGYIAQSFHESRPAMKYPDPTGLLFFGVGIVFGEMMIVSYLFEWRFSAKGVQPTMSYPELVSILLTGIAVILAVLALFIASLAIWGYSQFKDLTRSASAEHLEKMLQAGAFRDEIEALIIKHVSAQLERGELRKILVERVDTIIQGDAASRAAQTGPTADSDFKD